jgi:pyrimidine and pyridine-specific 5'-nucleotidase
VDDLFEGMTFCDYGKNHIVCKPREEMYVKGMKEAGVVDAKDCYFVGMYSHWYSGAQRC